MGKNIRFFLFTGLAAIILIVFTTYYLAQANQPPIRVGVLHSLSGTMAISESAVADATLLAIEEINAQGGVLGRQIEPVVVDGQSDWPTFAGEAERLIVDEHVSVIFGCWTSACRKTVKPVMEKYQHLLFYPVQYEGLESSPNIIYTGAAPNQQIIPAVKWAMDNLGRRFFLAGSDYVFPRTANAIIRDQVKALRGEVLGEGYVPLGSSQVEALVEEIVKTRPDVILNTINGDTNVAFFRALRQAGITPQEIPTISFSLAETELQSIDVAAMVGDYAAWNYFQSLSRPENIAFVKRFQAKYGSNRVVSDPMESAYFGVYLWAQAVTEAQSDEVNLVRATIGNQSMDAPGGVVFLDPETQHTWKPVRIGQINAQGQFDIVWDSDKPVRPVPYPIYRPAANWNQFLQDLYTGWGNNWAAPTPTESP